MILDRVLKEGDSLPSVRNVAAKYLWLGAGEVSALFINAGAHNSLPQGKRQMFLRDRMDWVRLGMILPLFH